VGDNGNVSKIRYSTTVTHRPAFAEYIEFLKISELGRMYPKKNFNQRIRRLLRNADVFITAREENRLSEYV